MLETIVRGKLIALPAFGLALLAQPMQDVPSQDLAEINSQLASMLASPKGQIREWSSSAGNRGQIKLGPAIDTVAGNPCTSWQSCDEPCRNLEYSFVGQDRAGQTVDNAYRQYYCFRGGSWASIRSIGTTRRVLAAKPEPPRTIVVREKQTVAALAPAHAMPRAMPTASRVQPNLIQSLQQRLRGLLYYAGPETGRLDEPTLEALRAFLVDEGLEVGDMRAMGAPDLVFLDSRLRDAGERGRFGSCKRPGRFVACGTVR